MNEPNAQLAQIIQLEKIAKKYGMGMTSRRMVEELIDNHEELQKDADLHGMPAIRSRITDYIRAANPGSSAFSEQYRTPYENTNEVTIKALQPLLHID